MCFIQHYKMGKITQGQAKIQNFKNEYQPTQYYMMLKNLHSNFAELGIQYKHPNDFFSIWVLKLRSLIINLKLMQKQ